MANYHITIVQPDGYLHSECFREIAEGFLWSLQALGHAAVIAENTIDANVTNIVLGAHLLTEEETQMLFPSTILYNLEQLGSARLPVWYTGLASRLRVWDYSALNMKWWSQLPCLVAPVLVEVGFVPELRRIAPAPEQDIDVLFYGSGNDRRTVILDQLQAAGLKVQRAFGVYGRERDALIARAKVVLNVHFYETEIFEIVRVSYLLTNGKAVVSERSPDLGDLAEAVDACSYDELVGRCIALVADPAERRALESRGASIFARRNQVDIICAVLAAEEIQAPAPPSQRSSGPFPRRLNLGSGKDWREDCLNVDINDYWKPDAVLDISQAQPPILELATERFGTIRIEPGCFSEILANDVLEHIPNLTGAMGAALRLLDLGGLFNIQVPYDLSWGGWQDPTHVRAFNERSWLYYTEWFWYLGWTEARFTLEKIEFVLSSVGEKLKLTCSNEELVRTPRAVDSMRVCLRKRLLDDVETRFVTNYLKRPERTEKVFAGVTTEGVKQISQPIKAVGVSAQRGNAGTNQRAADRGKPALETQVVRLRTDTLEGPDDSSDELNERLYAAIPMARRILEFGCAKGRVGERYKQAHPDAFWAGVDRSEQALATASKRLDATRCINTDGDLIDDLGGNFDCVVVGDLPEHLRPAKFLASLRSLTTPDATLVCCVPNMGHISVIERMLMGDVAYDCQGLLDETHLRSFPQRSLFKMLLDAGWLPHLQDAYVLNPTNARLTDGLLAAAEMAGLSRRTAARHLLTHQMIVRCSKTADRQRETVDAPGAVFSVIVAVSDQAQLNLNVLQSPGLKEVSAEIILVRNAASAAEAFAKGAERASSPWRLFCHQDVYFPSGSGRTIASLLARVPSAEKINRAIGFAGLGVEGETVSKAGLVVDRTELFNYPASSRAIAMDEFCVVLHRDFEYSIDESLGWHFWATDLCLQTIHSLRGANFANIVRVPLFHNSRNDGILSASYHQSEKRMLAKYPNLPAITSLNGTITQPSLPVATMLLDEVELRELASR